MAGPTANPFLTAFACAAVTFAIGISVVLGLSPQLASSAQASEALGRVFGIVAIPALVAGFLARRSATPWSVVRIVVVYVVALIVVAATQVPSAAPILSRTGTKDTSLKAKNASQDMMLTVDDYLLMLPKTEPMERVREATRAKDAVNHFRESWPTPTGNYELLYLHRSGGAIVTCQLIVAANEAEARRAADELFRGVMTGMREKQEMNLSSVSGLEAWHPEGRFYFVTEKAGLPFANIFLLRKSNNVVLVVSRGPYVYNDPRPIKEFLGKKIDGLLSFRPDF